MSGRSVNRKNAVNSPAIAGAKTHTIPRVSRDGTLHVGNLVIPPSNLCSPELKEFYARRIANANRPVLTLPARTATKAEWDEFDAWQDSEQRVSLRCALERYPVEVVDTSIAGVRVGIVSPRDGVARVNQDRVLINLHGGGFVHNRGLTFGLIESIPVASIGRIKVITLDYRQAPFHRYPAATEDVEAVYLELLKSHAPSSIGIFGCSAGGMLTSQAVAWFRSKNLPRPGAVGILSIAPPPPCVPDARCWGESAIWFSGVPTSEFTAQDQSRWEPTGWYMEGADRDDPVAYPGLSDAALAAFPPTLLLSGTRDFAMSTTAVAHARFLKLRVDSSLYIMEGGIHGAHAVAIGTPEAHDAQTYIANWFSEHLRQ